MTAIYNKTRKHLLPSLECRQRILELIAGRPSQCSGRLQRRRAGRTPYTRSCYPKGRLGLNERPAYACACARVYVCVCICMYMCVCVIVSECVCACVCVRLSLLVQFNKKKCRGSRLRFCLQTFTSYGWLDLVCLCTFFLCVE
jgi:hypothetical protein